MNLYELAAEYRAVSEQLDANGGEVTPEIEDALARITDGFAAKVDAIGGLIKEAEAHEYALKSEASEMCAKADARRRTAVRLKAWLFRNMKDSGVEKVKGKWFRARLAKASTPRIAWQGPGEIPDGFARVHVEVDGPAAHAAYRSHTLPEGFAVTHSEYLDLR